MAEIDPLSDAKVIDSWRKNARNANVTITIAATAFAGGTGKTIVAADNAAGAGAARGFVLSDR